jgi:hypothetical protein
MLHVGQQGVRDKVLGVGEGGFGSLCCKKKDIIRSGPGERSTEDECNTLGWNQLKFNPELGGSNSIMSETVTIRVGWGGGVSFQLPRRSLPLLGTMALQLILHGQLNDCRCLPDRIQEVGPSGFSETVIRILSPRVIIIIIIITFFCIVCVSTDGFCLSVRSV